MKMMLMMMPMILIVILLLLVIVVGVVVVAVVVVVVLLLLLLPVGLMVVTVVVVGGVPEHPFMPLALRRLATSKRRVFLPLRSHPAVSKPSRRAAGCLKLPRELQQALHPPDCGKDRSHGSRVGVPAPDASGVVKPTVGLGTTQRPGQVFHMSARASLAPCGCLAGGLCICASCTNATHASGTPKYDATRSDVVEP